MLRILVTGANGFIGKNFQEFLKVNYPKSECTFLIGKKGKISKKSFGKFIKVDLSKELPKVLSSKRFDFVFHLAALNFTNIGKVDLHKLLEVNSFGTLKVLKFFKFKNFIYFSTAKSYGLNSGKILDEKAIPHPVDDYSISKYFGELFIQNEMNFSKAKFFIFRSVNVYGPKQSLKALVPVFFQNALSGKNIRVFGKNSKVQLVFIDDVLQAFKMVLDKRIPSGIYNLSSEKPLRLLEIAEKVKKISNSNSRIKIINKNLMSSFITSKKIESFGWIAKTSIDEGLKKVFENLKSN